ncbi:hypothetical protein T265_10757 [Opisthorchis viverrini]|uniref:Uncharacterized protein n=1 Tax=Opisthorchis viverrini TaxID=6198 RepID=A0A074ZC38_OPIVI|nr:hypothetical protein T265_10757 [Opisthorchis viverrini]KER20770.1 hypothetical protein T265_10757 [Opisthorchis viverrini]
MFMRVERGRLTSSTIFKSPKRGPYDIAPRPPLSTNNRCTTSRCYWSGSPPLDFLARLQLAKQSYKQCSPRDHCSIEARPPCEDGSFRSGEFNITQDKTLVGDDVVLRPTRIAAFTSVRRIGPTYDGVSQHDKEIVLKINTNH